MTLEERIERLERTNRRYRLMFTLIGVIAVCAVGISATQGNDIPEVIFAKSFVAVDGQGQPKAVLSALQGAGNLKLVSEGEGHPAMLTLQDKAGQPLFAAATLETKNGGAGFISTFTSTGKLLVMIQKSADSDAGVVDIFSDSKKTISLSKSKTGGGAVVVYNENEAIVAAMRADEQNGGVVAVADAYGNGRTLKPGP